MSENVWITMYDDGLISDEAIEMGHFPTLAKIKAHRPWKLNRKDILLLPLIGGHKHYCPDHGLLPIDDTMPEFDQCGCYNMQYDWRVYASTIAVTEPHDSLRLAAWPCSTAPSGPHSVRYGFPKD